MAISAALIEKYEDKHLDITLKLEEVVRLLNNHNYGSGLNHGHLGDLGSVDCKLAEVIEFLKTNQTWGEKPRRE